jgi:hypothetical protein
MFSVGTNQPGFLLAHQPGFLLAQTSRVSLLAQPAGFPCWHNQPGFLLAQTSRQPAALMITEPRGGGQLGLF